MKKLFKKIKEKKVALPEGFTLVEMLIAVTLFSIASVIIASIFINSITLEQNTLSYQKLQNNSRYILEKIAKEVRGRELVLIFPGENPTSSINFYPDEMGNVVSVYLGENNDLKYWENGLEDSLNTVDVAVEEFKVYILPVESPFSMEPASNIQPRVTIMLKLKNRQVGNDTDNKYTKELSVQTTISSKNYKR